MIAAYLYSHFVFRDLEMRFWKVLLLGLLVPVVALATTDVRRPSQPGDELKLGTESKRPLPELSRSMERRDFLDSSDDADVCSDLKSPEPISTPSPLFFPHTKRAAIKVNFVIGTSGTIESPVIVQGSSPAQDKVVIDTLKRWKYRPARCNGQPVEAEAVIEFPGA